MQTIALSEFQQHCAIILKRISQSNQAVLITDQEEVMVKILPMSPSKQPHWLGCMTNTGKITGDIVSPGNDSSDWAVLK